MEVQVPSFADLMRDEAHLRDFAFFSTNIQKLRPALAYSDHVACYVRLETLMGLATDDRRNNQWTVSYPETGQWIHALAEPGIIALFHTGPYRLPCFWLARRQIPFTLVVSSDVQEAQGETYIRWLREVAPDAGPDGFECLESGDPLIIRKLVRALRSGRFVVIYIDGNMGVGAQANKRNACTIDFLDGVLRVKTGAADLARITGAPVYPVSTRFDDELVPQINNLGPIRLNGLKSTSLDWRTYAMHRIYGTLERLVGHQPHQWEGWRYVHHDLLWHSAARGQGILWHFMPIRVGDRHFILDKTELRIYPSTKRLHAVLSEQILLKG